MNNTSHDKKKLEEIADRLTDMIMDRDCPKEEIEKEVRHSMDVMDKMKNK